MKWPRTAGPAVDGGEGGLSASPSAYVCQLCSTSDCKSRCPSYPNSPLLEATRYRTRSLPGFPVLRRLSLPGWRVALGKFPAPAGQAWPPPHALPGLCLEAPRRGSAVGWEGRAWPRVLQPEAWARSCSLGTSRLTELLSFEHCGKVSLRTSFGSLLFVFQGQGERYKPSVGAGLPWRRAPVRKGGHIPPRRGAGKEALGRRGFIARQEGIHGRRRKERTALPWGSRGLTTAERGQNSCPGTTPLRFNTWFLKKREKRHLTSQHILILFILFYFI